MNWKLRTSLLASTLMVLVACTKDYNTRVCESASTVEALCDVDSNKVNVRTYNNTGFPLCNLRVVWNSNNPEPVSYGRVEDQAVSCYVVEDQVKLYPYVFFQLGVREFAIFDTLTDPLRDYDAQLFNTQGFYNLRIEIRGTLDTGHVHTFWTLTQQ